MRSISSRVASIFCLRLLVVEELGAEFQGGDRRAKVVADRGEHAGAVGDEAGEPLLHPVEAAISRRTSSGPLAGRAVEPHRGRRRRRSRRAPSAGRVTRRATRTTMARLATAMIAAESSDGHGERHRLRPDLRLGVQPAGVVEGHRGDDVETVALPASAPFARRAVRPDGGGRRGGAVPGRRRPGAVARAGVRANMRSNGCASITRPSDERGSGKRSRRVVQKRMRGELAASASASLALPAEPAPARASRRRSSSRSPIRSASRTAMARSSMKRRRLTASEPRSATRRRARSWPPRVFGRSFMPPARRRRRQRHSRRPRRS